LNRDLWNDETIQSVINSEFIFWQVRRREEEEEGERGW